ncbi:hypothetical protein LPJ81_005901, partial [Coemansia sp. IMI 209127]
TDIDGSEFIELDDILAAAKSADKIVIGLGEHTYAENVGNIGELLLPERQLGLVYQIAAATNASIAVVLVQGRPRRLGKIPEVADAIVNAYLPGEYGGLPIAEILYGKVNPSGRLPYTYPATESQASTTVWQPAYSDYSPQWAFGYGLGYSTIEYSNVTVSNSVLAMDIPITVSVVVTNTGPYPQKEVVMLFTQQFYRFNLAPENNRLRKFAKVDVAVDNMAGMQMLKRFREIMVEALPDLLMSSSSLLSTVVMFTTSPETSLDSSVSLPSLLLSESLSSPLSEPTSFVSLSLPLVLPEPVVSLSFPLVLPVSVVSPESLETPEFAILPALLELSEPSVLATEFVVVPCVPPPKVLTHIPPEHVVPAGQYDWNFQTSKMHTSSVELSLHVYVPGCSEHAEPSE